MKKFRPQHYPTLYSAVLHAFGIVCLFILFLHDSTPHPKSISIDLEVREKIKAFPNSSTPQPAEVLNSPKKSSFPHLDFRPSYMKGNGILSRTHAEPSNDSTSEQLNRPVYVINAFDQLAAQLNRNLDYPALLVEQNVMGTATFDLYFDQAGNVSETTSQFSGSHTAIRGLLVKAARLALVEWYRSDAYRLNPDQFKGQHFHTDYSISYTVPGHDGMEKTSQGDYHIVKVRSKTCGGPLGVDLICVAEKTKGAVENLLTDKSRIQADLLKDKLAHYDDMGLTGINELIHEHSG